MLSFSLINAIELICCNSYVITMQFDYYFVFWVYVDFNSQIKLFQTLKYTTYAIAK